MKFGLVLASTALCLGLATTAQAQFLALSTMRTGLIPQGGGIVGIQGTITNTSSQLLTITGDTITVVNGSVFEDYIATDSPFGSRRNLVINPGSSYNGHTSSSANNQTVPGTNNLVPGVNITPYLFTIAYGTSNPTDVSQGTIQLTYTLGTSPTAFTTTIAFGTPAAITPEPGTMALMGSGLISGGLFMARRRRK